MKLTARSPGSLLESETGSELRLDYRLSFDIAMKPWPTDLLRDGYQMRFAGFGRKYFRFRLRHAPPGSFAYFCHFLRVSVSHTA